MWKKLEKSVHSWKVPAGTPATWRLLIGMVLAVLLQPAALLADAREPRTVPLAADGSEILWLEPGERVFLEVEVPEPGIFGLSTLSAESAHVGGYLAGVREGARIRLVERSLRHLVAQVAPGRLAVEVRLSSRSPAGTEVRVESRFVQGVPEASRPRGGPLKSEGGGEEDDDEIEIEPDPFQEPAGQDPGADPSRWARAVSKNGDGGEDDDEIEIEPDPFQEPGHGDPGDSFLLAERLLPGRLVSGRVGGPEGDVDVFRIRLPSAPEEGGWKLLVASTADAALYDARGHRLALDPGAVSADGAGFETVLLSGEYFLELRAGQLRAARSVGYELAVLPEP